MSFFMEKRLGKFKNGLENLLFITVRGCHTSTPSKKNQRYFRGLRIVSGFLACQRVSTVEGIN